jgi:hypothetical protein
MKERNVSVNTIISVTVTDGNEFNDGWLRYLLGLDRPAGERDEDGRPTPGQNGWDMGSDTPAAKMVRHVFTRQNDIEHPQYIVTARVEIDEPEPEKQKAEPLIVVASE